MKEIIAAIEQKLQQQFKDEPTGHDWHHIDRVRKTALEIGRHEGGNLHTIELIALLHDIDDHKFNGGDLEAGAKTAGVLLREFAINEKTINQITQAIAKISFKGAHVNSTPDCLEGKIVQDADRLDAIGAIGIARAFAYGGNRNRPLYAPEVAHELHTTAHEYINAKSHTINHFYEKLLLLKDKMNTQKGLEIAQQRHDFMESFLKQFYEEWG